MPCVSYLRTDDVPKTPRDAFAMYYERMSTLLFWQGRGKGANGAPNGRNWLHAPDALVKGHVAYLVKFLGCTPVDQPKGIEVVKDAINKLLFTQQLRKSETKEAAKCKKVEITISVDGVAIQEPRTTNILYQFPLHKISYCADDKGAKKYFSFIAKGSTVNGVNGHDGSTAEKQECFVFISTKLASEITLTIGQAFDLAYRRFLTDNGKFIEMQKLTLEKKKLELQMNAYKSRLQELSKITYKDDLSAYLSRNSLSEITEFKTPGDLEKQLASLTQTNGFGYMNGNKTPESGVDTISNHSESFNNSFTTDLLHSTPPPVHNGKASKMDNSTPLYSKNPSVGPRLEELLLGSDSDDDFDPRGFASESPAQRATPPFPAPRADLVVSPPATLPPPPKSSKRQTPAQQPPPQQAVQPITNDIFGSGPFTVPTVQPPTIQTTSPFAPQNINKPNYDINSLDFQTSVFSDSTSFTNNLSYDAFDTQKNGNIFGNVYGNGFSGFGNLSDKPTVDFNSSFNGLLDKTVTNMKGGFSRGGITFGNHDSSIDNLDPLRKN